MKIMKIIKYTFFITAFLLTSCNLDETPPFLDESIYQDPASAIGARDGIYQAISSYNSQEHRLFVENLYGGLMYTTRGGGQVTGNDQVTINSLKPGYHPFTEQVWQGLYTVVSRSNGVINATTLPNDNNTLNDVAGNAFFARGWAYFKLAELWGDLPLWLELPDSNNTDKALSSEHEVYAQILSDFDNADTYLKGENQDIGYPKKWAANMMEAKVWMKLATNSDLRDALGYSEAQCWSNAYDEAKKVYDSGQYSLLPNFSDLFNRFTGGENTSESIFELQASAEAANSQMGRNFTPWRYKGTARNGHFGCFRVARVFHDYHCSIYGTKGAGNGINSVTIHDKRYEGTYISFYNQAYPNPNNTARVYPTGNGNNNMGATQPYHFKFTEKDRTSMNQYGDQNLIDLRYAEVLLMLAEISNELGNGEQMIYLTPVLERAGVAGEFARPEWTQGQEAFRNAIMDEYKFELVGEGYDGFHARRRGYDYFLNNTILRNNNPINNSERTLFYSFRRYQPNREIVFSTNEDEVMKIPIPLSEINTNSLIN